MVRFPRRGEVYWADLDPVVGSEQGGRRPVIIVQNDVGNRRADTTVVVPVTTRRAREGLKVNVGLPERALPRPSMAKCSQIRTIDKSRLLGEPVVTLDSAAMAAVDRALLVSLGMY